MAYPQAPPGAPKKSGHAVYGPAAAPALVGPMTHLEAILPFVWPAAQLAPKDIRNHPPSQTVLTNFGDSRIFLQMLSRRDAREGDDFRAFLEEVKAVPPPTGGYGATRLGATEYLTTEAELSDRLYANVITPVKEVMNDCVAYYYGREYVLGAEAQRPLVLHRPEVQQSEGEPLTLDSPAVEESEDSWIFCDHVVKLYRLKDPNLRNIFVLEKDNKAPVATTAQPPPRPVATHSYGTRSKNHPANAPQPKPTVSDKPLPAPCMPRAPPRVEVGVACLIEVKRFGVVDQASIAAVITRQNPVHLKHRPGLYYEVDASRMSRANVGTLFAQVLAYSHALQCQSIFLSAYHSNFAIHLDQPAKRTPEGTSADDEPVTGRYIPTDRLLNEPTKLAPRAVLAYLIWQGLRDLEGKGLLTRRSELPAQRDWDGRMANQAFFGMIGPLPEPTGENAPPDSPTLPVAARHHERQALQGESSAAGLARHLTNMSVTPRPDDRPRTDVRPETSSAFQTPVHRTGQVPPDLTTRAAWMAGVPSTLDTPGGPSGPHPPTPQLGASTSSSARLPTPRQLSDQIATLFELERNLQRQMASAFGPRRVDLQRQHDRARHERNEVERQLARLRAGGQGSGPRPGPSSGGGGQGSGRGSGSAAGWRGQY